MRVPYGWMADYCDPGLEPRDLAEKMAMTGTEVERVVTLGPPSAEGFVIGKVLAVEKHPDADRLNVVHPDIAHTNPGVVQHRDDGNGGKHTYPCLLEQCLPAFVTGTGSTQQQGNQSDYINQHPHCGDTLPQPVTQAVMSPNNNTVYHTIAPTTAVKARLTASTALAVARAVCNSVPLCMSSARKRTPAAA